MVDDDDDDYDDNSVDDDEDGSSGATATLAPALDGWRLSATSAHPPFLLSWRRGAEGVTPWEPLSLRSRVTVKPYHHCATLCNFLTCDHRPYP